MKQDARLCSFAIVLAAGLASAATTNGTLRAAADFGMEWTKWFSPQAALKPVTETTFPLFAVIGMAGQTNGWVFRTDHVAPAVRGKRGEIGVLVGLGTDGRIKGVQVVQHHEDLAWFNRLKAGFYAQFKNHPADGSGTPVDTVATATVSSKAIVDDVFKSSKTVMDLPPIKSQIHSAPSAR